MAVVSLLAASLLLLVVSFPRHSLCFLLFFLKKVRPRWALERILFGAHGTLS